MSVERADHAWVHGRDHDPRQERLRSARVGIVGCGSIGSPLSRLLAQAGVANFTLIDGQPLDWPNIGRHALGAGAIRRNKAVALAEMLEQDFPHLGEITAYSRDLRAYHRECHDREIMPVLVPTRASNTVRERDGVMIVSPDRITRLSGTSQINQLVSVRH